MNSLVSTGKGQLLTNTLVVAEGMNIEHRAVMTLVDKYAERLKTRGILTFEMLKKTKGERRGRKMRYAVINESQFIFLCTLMRNSEEVLEFKDLLTKEFMRQRKVLNSLAVQKQNLEWQKTRSQGKLIRREETDVIKEFVEYAKSQGSSRPEMYYVNLSKATNKALFIVQDKFPNLREVLNTIQLVHVTTADSVVSMAIKEGMKKELHYKDIYKLCKERLEAFAELVGKSTVVQIMEAPIRKKLE